MAEEIRTHQEPRPEPLSVLWRILAAPQTLFVLGALLAVVLATGSLIPQIPPEARDDPQAWLATQPGALGHRDSLIGTLGLYDLYHGFWFRLLLAVIALVLFVRLMNAAELAWYAVRRSVPPSAAGIPWGRQAPRAPILSSLPLEEVQDRLLHGLGRDRYRVTAWTEGSPARWLVSRWPGLLWIQVVGYGALLVAMAGLAISSYWGWRDEIWRPLPGETRPVGHGSPYTLRLDSLVLRRDRAGRLEDSVSRVTWLEGMAVAQETVVTSRRPASFAGFGLRQLGYLPIVQLQGWDGSGNPLGLELPGEGRPRAAKVEIRFLEAEEQPVVFVPAKGWFWALVFEPMGRGGQPVVHVDSLGEDGSRRERLASLASSGEIVASDLRLRVELSYVPILRLDRSPGMGWVAPAMGLAVLGLLVLWIAQPRLASVVLESQAAGEIRIHVASPLAAGRQPWLAQLAAALQEVLEDDG